MAIKHREKEKVVSYLKGLSGKVYVRFTVSKEGTVENVTVARGVDPILDIEAVLNN